MSAQLNQILSIISLSGFYILCAYKTEELYNKKDELNETQKELLNKEHNKNESLRDTQQKQNDLIKICKDNNIGIFRMSSLLDSRRLLYLKEPNYLEYSCIVDSRERESLEKKLQEEREWR